MATDYSKLTRKELVSAVEAMEQGYTRLIANAEEAEQLIEELEAEAILLRATVIDMQPQLARAQALNNVLLDMLAGMTEYLRE